MIRPLRTTSLALAALALSSCATTNLVQVWRDPNYRAAPVNRIFVVAIIPNQQYRVTFENAIAQALASKGFQVATSAGVFPPGQLDKERVVAYVKETNVDLVVVQRLAKQTQAEYVPPSVAYVPPAPYYGGWYGYYGYGYGAVYSPGYYTENTYVTAETNVYAAKAAPESLVWSGNSSTFNFNTAQEAATSVAASIVDDLIKAGILVH
ncbi:MAG TPA: hypothetical protein VMK42_08610 [Anaeromyxobacteraceae bacterium]|nr:hypothetical protein [Anaeromyxobacteraceae bacterium]